MNCCFPCFCRSHFCCMVLASSAACCVERIGFFNSCSKIGDSLGNMLVICVTLSSSLVDVGSVDGGLLILSAAFFILGSLGLGDGFGLADVKFAVASNFPSDGNGTFGF